MNVHDDKKVKIVANNLGDREFTWWNCLQTNKTHHDKNKIKSWLQIKKMLVRKYFPNYYDIIIFDKKVKIVAKQLKRKNIYMVELSTN